MTKERARKLVRDEVISLRINDGDGWPRTLDEFVDLLIKARLSVPEEYRAEILVVPDCDFDSPGSVDFYYDRPETDQEMVERHNQHARYAWDKENHERATYERLKEKFGS